MRPFVYERAADPNQAVNTAHQSVARAPMFNFSPEERRSSTS
jgi:hypothetical protein